MERTEDEEIKLHLQSYIVRQLVLQTRSLITGKNPDSKIEFIIADYISREIISHSQDRNRIPRNFQWGNRDNIFSFDHLVCALKRESGVDDSRVIKSAFMRSFLEGQDFSDSDFLEKIPEKIRLLFLELLTKNDKEVIQEYERYVANTYGITIQEIMAVRKDGSYEAAIQNVDTVREIILEVFQEIGWNELYQINEEFHRKLGLQSNGFFYPDFIIFPKPKRNDANGGRTLMSVGTSFKLTPDPNTNSIQIEFDEDDIISAYPDGFLYAYGTDTRTDLKARIFDTIIHEVAHLYSKRSGVIFSDKVEPAGKVNFATGTGLVETYYNIYEQDGDSYSYRWNKYHSKLNEILTELYAHYLQNNYRPKQHDTHKIRDTVYDNLVDAFGVLIVVISRESGIEATKVLQSFFHYYFGKKDIYIQAHLDEIVADISDENKRDAILLAIYDLLGDDTRTKDDTYSKHLLNEFRLSDTEIELAKNIRQLI